MNVEKAIKDYREGQVWLENEEEIPFLDYSNPLPGNFNSLLITACQWEKETGTLLIEICLDLMERVSRPVDWNLYICTRDGKRCLFSLATAMSEHKGVPGRYQLQLKRSVENAGWEEGLVMMVSAGVTPEQGKRYCAYTYAYTTNPLCSLSPVYEHLYPKKEKETVYFRDGVMCDSMHPLSSALGAEDPNHIIVALWREPEAATDCDYVCLLGRTPKAQGDHPILGLPGEGTFIFAKGESAEAVSAICTLTRCSGDGKTVAIAAYGSNTYENSRIEMYARGNELHYKMAVNWKQGFDSSTGHFELIPFDYTMLIRIRLKTLGSAESIPVTLCITSRDIQVNVVEHVLPVQIMYGCLAKGTMITMADGRKKAIEHIKIGERVESPSGRDVGVVNIWRGMEESVVVCRLENGMELSMSSMQPLAQPMGRKRAGDLKVGDVLLTESGKASLSSIAAGEGEEVWQLQLESAGSFYANGIEAGDMAVQNDSSI